jgi:hypothetical protein
MNGNLIILIFEDRSFGNRWLVRLKAKVIVAFIESWERNQFSLRQEFLKEIDVELLGRVG